MKENDLCKDFFAPTQMIRVQSAQLVMLIHLHTPLKTKACPCPAVGRHRVQFTQELQQRDAFHQTLTGLPGAHEKGQ